jgi:CubicO group peptidase (beta-lactamase class C family)
MTPARRDELQRRLQTAFKGLATKDTPGFAALVKYNGIVLLEEGFGVRDLHGKASIDARTNFRLASCTKQFTAMAVMLLVHDRKLRYDETLTEIFPEFPAYGRSITVRNLLNHTSGLPAYEDLMDAAEKAKGPLWSPENQIRDDEVLRLLEKESRGKFAPGTQWEYSNSGYVVLGLIAAKRSGMSYGNFLRERIFMPLTMAHTLVFAKGENEVAARAYGHSKKARQFVETDQSPTSATQGDGDVYSNLEDLSKWDDALRNHTLLGEKEFAAAITPAALPPGAEQKLAEDAPPSLRGKAVSYGFGWFLDLKNPHPLMWHYGDTMGFRTAILRYLDSKVTAIVLCNRTDLDAGTLALKASELISAK